MVPLEGDNGNKSCSSPHYHKPPSGLTGFRSKEQTKRSMHRTTTLNVPGADALE